jgi:hypothetical protein
MCASSYPRVALLNSHIQNGAMSLPGLGLSEPEEVAQSEVIQHNLDKESEWRFEVAAGKYIQVKVRSITVSALQARR